MMSTCVVRPTVINGGSDGADGSSPLHTSRVTKCGSHKTLGHSYFDRLFPGCGKIQAVFLICQVTVDFKSLSRFLDGLAQGFCQAYINWASNG